MKAEKIREDFPFFHNNELAYLDNAATTQTPRTVIEAVRKVYEEKNANPGRGVYQLSEEATKTHNEARRGVAEFIGSRPENLVFVQNSTEASNRLIKMLQPEKTVVSRLSHHSEQLPARKTGETVFTDTENGRVDLESVKEKVDDSTDLVTVPHVSNVTGKASDVKAVAEIAHDHGALVAVDAAQSTPHLGIDVGDLGADFLYFSGHKTLGPFGSGALYIRESIDTDRLGGGAIETVGEDSYSLRPMPEGLEPGTPNLAAEKGLAAGVNYLQDLGMDEVERHTRELASTIGEGLSEVEGVQVVSPRDSLLVSFSVEGVHPHDVAKALDDQGFAVRAGHHCAQPLHNSLGVDSTVRASPYIYNTREEAEKLVESTRELVKAFNV